MNSHATLFCFVIAGALFLAACDLKTPVPVTGSAGTPTAPGSTAATLTASPNPVPAGSTPGTTTIKWSTGGSPAAEVYVSTDGGPEVLFATGAQGSSGAPWIQSGMNYEFRLYAGSAHKELLMRLPVTRKE